MIIKSKDSGNAKFTRQELEVLEVFTDEEIKTILEYQEKLPILVENTGIKDFCVDARVLWSQLGSPQGQFNKWVERYFKAYGFTENVDFIPFGQNSPKINCKKGRPSVEYLLTIDMGKQLAMVNKKNIGFIARRYFILMEKAVQKRGEWLGVRNPEKYGYKVMDEALDRWTERNWHHKTTKYEYAVEADMLNEIVLGMKSKDKKRELGITRDDLLRDYLHKNYNEQLAYLQQMNTEFLNANYRWSERVAMLTRMYNAKFGNMQETNSIVA